MARPRHGGHGHFRYGQVRVCRGVLGRDQASGDGFWSAQMVERGGARPRCALLAYI
jgi:hypothetical protein